MNSENITYSINNTVFYGFYIHCKEPYIMQSKLEKALYIKAKGMMIIMSKEYDTLRNEIEENLKKQDSINNLIFTILGLSFAFSTWYENIAFIIMILFISDILLARIIQCRNTVYYLSTYLVTIENNNQENDINWEKNLKEFRKQKYGLPFKFNIVNIIIWLSFSFSSIIKNFGNLVLAFFMFIQLIKIIQYTNLSDLYLTIIYSATGLCLLFNIIFTTTICIDKRIRNEYENRWSKIVKKNMCSNQKEIESETNYEN